MHRSVKGAIIGFITFFLVGTLYYYSVGVKPSVYFNYGTILGILGLLLFAYVLTLRWSGLVGAGGGFLIGFLAGALPSYNAGAPPGIYLLYGVILGVIGFVLGSTYANMNW